MTTYAVTTMVEADPVTDSTGTVTGYQVTVPDGTRTVDAATFEAFFAPAAAVPAPPEGNPA